MTYFPAKEGESARKRENLGYRYRYVLSQFLQDNIHFIMELDPTLEETYVLYKLLQHLEKFSNPSMCKEISGIIAIDSLLEVVELQIRWALRQDMFIHALQKRIPFLTRLVHSLMLYNSRLNEMQDDDRLTDQCKLICISVAGVLLDTFYFTF